MFDYDADAKAAAEELDKHDLTDNVARCWRMRKTDPWDIKQFIQSESIPEHMELFESLENLSSDELMEYLGDRYGVRFEEKISYRMLRPPFIKD